MVGDIVTSDGARVFAPSNNPQLGGNCRGLLKVQERLCLATLLRLASEAQPRSSESER